MNINEVKIAVVGLGYVGLPLAVEFGKKFHTIAFDINTNRVQQLRQGIDHTGETTTEDLCESNLLTYSSDEEDLRPANVYVITVPTPVDEANRPDLSPLISASKTVGRMLKGGDLVIYESTVYPGTTEEICVPILESNSNLIYNQDFFCGYSPERINPGDKVNRLPTIKKITSGSTPEAANFVDTLYRQIIEAGTHKAPSIKVAEAAKVIENTQRDVNIALINELAMIFGKLGIDTHDVLTAAGTKWNFLPFKPGLVGGHCIGVDPYYLTHKATILGYHPELILAARRINSRMGIHVAHQLVRRMATKRIQTVGAKVLILGLTFKEDCSDLRNTRVTEISNELQTLGCVVEVYDPWVSSIPADFCVNLITEPTRGSYDGIVLAVAHSLFKEWTASRIRSLGKETVAIYDIKGILPPEIVDERL